MTVELRPGMFISVGIDKPWYTSESMIASANRDN